MLEIYSVTGSVGKVYYTQTELGKDNALDIPDYYCSGDIMMATPELKKDEKGNVVGVVDVHVNVWWCYDENKDRIGTREQPY